MSLKHLSKTAKEKHADSLMKLSSSIFTALVVTLFVAPLLIILKGNNANNGLFILDSLKGINGIFFMVCEFVVIAFAVICKKKALVIYNELDAIE